MTVTMNNGDDGALFASGGIGDVIMRSESARRSCSSMRRRDCAIFERRAG